MLFITYLIHTTWAHPLTLNSYHYFCYTVGRPGGPQALNIRPISFTMVQVSWTLQANSVSTSFTITCNSSSPNTVSLSGPLQDTQSDEGMYTATLSGLNLHTLYTCCLSLRDEKLGSSVPQCHGVQPIITPPMQVQSVQDLSPVVLVVGIVIGLVVGAGGTALVLLVVVIAVKKRASSSVSSK